MVMFILVLICIGLLFWASKVFLKAFDKYPEVGQMIKKSFKKQPHRMKVYNFSEYPLIASNGFIFEVIEAKKSKARLWTIKINVFNANDESKKVKLVRTGFKWKNRSELYITDSNLYTVKSSTGLISSSQMIVWSMNKPESISITYLSNDEPGSVFIDLKKEKQAVSDMKKVKSLKAIDTDEKRKVANETLVVDSNKTVEELNEENTEILEQNTEKGKNDESDTDSDLKVIDRNNTDDFTERSKKDEKE